MANISNISEAHIRVCKKCGQGKPLDSFLKARTCVHGRQWTCKTCAKNWQAAHYQKHKDSYYNKFKERAKADPTVRFAASLRAQLATSLRRKRSIKSDNTFSLMGCTPRQAIYHLTNGGHEIPRGMHIDHYIPLNLFNLGNPDEQKVCFNWRNLQLLPAAENIRKRDSLPPDYRERLKAICEAIGVAINPLS